MLSMRSLRGRVLRWLDRFLQHRGYRRFSEFALPLDMVVLHERVLKEFPDTPWVAGGLWSWYSDFPSGNVVAIAYPYLPLVLLFKEDDVICDAANRLGIVYHVHGRPMSELEGKLEALKRRNVMRV